MSAPSPSNRPFIGPCQIIAFILQALLILGLLTLAGLLFAAPAHAQPDRVLHLSGPDGVAIEAGIWLPADAADGGARPLVVISHGNGGWLRGHEDTAEALAGAGFIVAALTHPGDNYADQSRSTLVTARAPQLSALIDAVLADHTGPVSADPQRIGAFGFSAGGFTVIHALGGQPSMRAIADYCAQHPDHFACTLYARQPIDPALWRPEAKDGRIRAAVVAAPALGLSFAPDSLRSITVPVQLWRAGRDEILPSPFNVEPIAEKLGATPDLRVEPGAMHFDFLTPCGPDDGRPGYLCTSAPGFDRAAFKTRFNAEVVAFFQRTLAPSAP